MSRTRTALGRNNIRAQMKQEAEAALRLKAETEAQARAAEAQRQQLEAQRVEEAKRRDRRATLSAAALCLHSNLPTTPTIHNPTALLGSFDAPPPSPGEASVSPAGDLILGAKTITQYRARLKQTAAILASTHIDLHGGALAYATIVFASAADRYLQQTEQIKANLNNFAVMCLPMMCAAIQSEILLLLESAKKGAQGAAVDWSPANRDSLFLAVANMFIATLSQIIVAESSRAASAHPLFRKDDLYLRSLVAKFLVDNSRVSADSIVVTSLTKWLQIVANANDEEFSDVSRNAKLASQMDLAYWTQYRDQLKSNTLQSKEQQDFKDQRAYETWKQSQLSICEARIKSLSSTTSSKTITEFPDSARDLFIPDARETYYLELLRMCILHDVKPITEANDPTSMLSELSSKSVALLEECAMRWRLTKAWTAMAYVSVVVQLYVESVFEITDICGAVLEIFGDHGGPAFQKRSEDQFYLENLENLQKYMLLSFNMYRELFKLPRDSANAQIQAFAIILQAINADPLWIASKRNSPDYSADVTAFLYRRIASNFQRNFDKLFAKFCREDRLSGLVLLTHAISVELDQLNGFFYDKIYDAFHFSDVAESVYIQQNLIELLEELKSLSNKDDMNIVLGPEGLYNEVSELFGKLDDHRHDQTAGAATTGVKKYDIEEFFRPYIELWLDQMKDQWSEWATNAIRNDSFIPIMAPTTMYSSSIRDIFGFFNNGLKFIKKMKEGATDPERQKILLIKFLRVMGKSIETFADGTFKEFEEFSFANHENEIPANFNPQQCIKLNNLVGAKRQLELIFTELNVAINSDLPSIDPTARRIDIVAGKFSLKVTVVRALNLPVTDAHSADPFVIIKRGTLPDPIGVSTIISRSLNPVWNQSWKFQGANDQDPGSFYFQICQVDGRGREQPFAQSQMAISFADPLFNDFLTHDVPLGLMPQGMLMLRVLRLGEIEDVDFWIRYTKETLEYTAEKMVRVFSDTIVRYGEIVWTKCANSFKIGPGIFGYGTSNAALATAPVDESKVEQAMMPFFKYLDQNLTIMNENLDRKLLDEFLAGPFFLGYNPATNAQQKQPAIGDADMTALLRTFSVKERIDIDKPSLLALVVWNELLTRMHSSVTAFKSNDNGATAAAATTERRQVEALVIVLEYLKAFFYCDLGGRCCGFPTRILENVKYREVRAMMRVLVPDSILFSTAVASS
ncbi:hypothetical protein HK100_000740 [Physocladia obscura]|uniref:C2 domain-containing protein n=1 Tax=Physocladia obscura TaxID=109957 RepID=A0AAD5XKC1_9FUNG|nr:hypothetical protein HK100_000740 [Physocladia obscura]